MIEAKELLIYLSLKYEGDWDEIFHALTNQEYDYSVNDVRNAVDSIKSKYITILDPLYPEYLKRTFKPPFVLYYYGNISLIQDINSSIAIIGSRKNTSYGEQMANKIIPKLAKDMTIVSGLAKGIDAIAHQITLDNNGKTVAVLGCGIESCYPLDNILLYNNIKEKGLIISEYPKKTSPDKLHFPHRNRLIAAFAKSVFVVEASKRSGTLITVNVALELGKDVFCLPQRADEESGCNFLIKNGAALVESAEDILEELSGKNF